MKKNHFLPFILTLFYIFPPVFSPCDSITENAEKYFDAYFILKKGNAFSSPHLAYLNRGIRLRFGQKIRCMKVSIPSLQGMEDIWFKCWYKNRSFYLPWAYIERKEYTRYMYDATGSIKIGTAVVNRDYSLPLNYIPGDLVTVPDKYKAPGYRYREMKLRKEALEAFKSLIDAAEKEGLNIRVISAFRDSEYQAGLYTRAITRKGIFQRSVAKPGHSEHQLGTTCDLTSSEIYYLLGERFEKTVSFKWLSLNSWRFGIYLSYPRLKQRITGYIYEPWHYRYWGRDHWKKLFSKYSILLE